MAGSGDGGAPVDHGITACAEGSAGVAGLCAGGLLICDGSRGMDMGGAMCGEVCLVHVGHGGIHLGIHMELLIGEGAGAAVHMGDLTHVNIHLHILCPELVSSPVGLGGVAGYLDVSIEVDDTDGQLCQNSIAGLGIDAGASDSDGGGVCLLCDGILSREAVSQIHVVQLPVVDVIQVNHSGDRLDGLDVGGLQVHPVDGAEGDSVQSSISWNHLDGGSIVAGLDLDHTDDHGLVACVVADLKLHAVITVCHSGIGGHHATRKGGRNFNAVNVNLSSCRIQAGSIVQGNIVLVGILLGGGISHSHGQCQFVAGSGDHITLNQSGTIDVGLIENGVLSVLNSLGVVNSEVIQIVGVVAVDRAVLCPQHVVDGLMEYNGQEELTLLASHTVAGIFIILLVCLQRNFTEGTDIHGQVMPAGLVDIVVNILGFHQTDHVVGVKDAVAVGVGLVVSLNPALNVVLRDIEPEANGAGILQCDGFAVHTQTDPGVLLRVGVLGMQAVGLQTHGVVAVMNLAVGAVCQGQSQLVIPVGSVLTVVDYIPDIDICLAALEVPENLGGLAQIQLDSGSKARIGNQSSGNRTGQILGSVLFIHSDKAQAVKSAQRLVGGGEGNVVDPQADLIQTAADGSLDRNGGSLAEGDGNNGLLKENFLRSSDVDGMLADYLSIVHHLHGHNALSAVGGEDAVFNGAHAIFLDSPFHVSRNVHLGADCIGAHSSESHRATRSVVGILRLDGSAGEHAVSGSGGDDQNGVGSGALAAVGQGAVDLQVLTGPLGAEGCGTAAVAVCGDDTAHLDHVLCHLVAGQTGGVGSLLTVRNRNHQGAVRTDTDEGSGSDAAAMIFSILVHGIAVSVGLDQESEQHGDCLLFPAGQGIQDAADPGLGHIRGSGLASDGVIVVVDDHDGLNTAGLQGTVANAAVAIILTVQNGVAQRLTDQMRILLVVSLGIPAQGTVGSNNHVAVAQLLRFQRLGGSGLDAVVTFLGPHTLGTGDNLDVGVIHVDDGSMHNLSAGTGIVVHNQLRLLDTGCNLPFLFGDDVVVITSAVAVIILACSQSVQGKNADQHDHGKQQSQSFGQITLFHVFSPYRNKYIYKSTLGLRIFCSVRKLQFICLESVVGFALFHRGFRQIVAIEAGQECIIPHGRKELFAFKFQLNGLRKNLRRQDIPLAVDIPCLTAHIAAALLLWLIGNLDNLFHIVGAAPHLAQRHQDALDKALGGVEGIGFLTF